MKKNRMFGNGFRRGGVVLAALLSVQTAVPAFAADFIMARPASTTSFDLHTEITSNNAYAIDQVFESLVGFDQKGELYDKLAKSHTISEDGKVYTFTLREGLTFSDGSDLTSEDVKFSLERHLQVGGALPIEASVASIEAPDEKTLVITLEEAFTPFISELANFSNGVIPKDFGGKTEEEFFECPIGSGPFAIESWDPTGDVTFVKNELYREEGLPAIDHLTFKTVGDDNQRINQLKAGEVDAVEGLAFANAGEIDAGADTMAVSCPGWEIEELFFNTLDEHLSDVHVRRALCMVLDREAIAQALTFGYGEASNTVLSSALRYETNDTVEALKADVEAAKEELALSAYPDGFETSVIVTAGNNVRAQEAQILQAAAAQIGIRVEIRSEEPATFREDFFNLNFDIMINSAVADYPDADSIMHFQVDPEGFSHCYWTNYTNDRAVELMHLGQTTPDGEERAAVYAELQQILADEVPYLPLYNCEIVYGVRSEVEGFEPLPNGGVNLVHVVKP